MQRIVFGILAVFFVQVGFQIYVAIEKTNYGYTRLALAGISAPNATPETASIEDSDSDSPSELVEMMTTRASRDHPATRRRRSVTASTSIARKPYPTDRAAVTAADFRPVVITIPPRPATTRIAEKNAYTVPSETRRHLRERRSFAQKAIAVVKKPYDWLKFAASKLL